MELRGKDGKGRRVKCGGRIKAGEKGWQRGGLRLEKGEKIKVGKRGRVKGGKGGRVRGGGKGEGLRLGKWMSVKVGKMGKG